ncbi:vWA domain-containing protein [Candidatus Marithrix sp. Canyon 246]|uniref:vWA domain-containing protein n=2 Tax=Candidatus Marithrix sp. Canyon 246 TaxID=1827136 RepID=UPI001495B9A7|nr:VWA-like domain-containing protein [Candidatus Marithrix sp. Canyon 246]
MAIIMTDIENKLATARTKLILDKPFLGALVLRLPMRAAEPKWCATSATDAKHFYYNPEYIEALNVDQVQFVLAHEALHCALSHLTRRQHRNKFRWDLACDYAINPLLLEEGLTPPPNVWIPEGTEGMTAEEIYPTIEENDSDEPMDKHIYGDNQQEQQNLETQWQQRLAGAAQQAQQAGKLNGAMARMVDHFLQPQLPWRMLLARYMTMMARDDYTYMRPSRREGSAIFPSLRSSQLEIIVALDISGSVTDKEISQCIAEINSLKGQMRARITLLACDYKLAEGTPWIYEPWEDFSAPGKFQGGGGTSFKPVFECVEQMQTPDLLVYFTDAKGEFPEQEPNYPVIWLVKGKAKVAWGQRIQLN